MESEALTLLLQLAREGGAAAGGALAVLLPVSWLVLSDRLVTGSRYREARKRGDTYRRELYAERRAHRKTVESYKATVIPPQKRGE